MPKSVYSIRAEAALRVHLSDIEKLMTVNVVTGKIDEAIREHLAVARAEVLAAHAHARAAGHLSEAFEREHRLRLETLAKMESGAADFLRDNSSR